MTTPSRSASLLAVRTGLAFVMLSIALLGAWTAGDLLGQQSTQKKERVEEEEDTPKAKTPAGKKKRIEEEEETSRKKPKRKVIRVEDDDDSKTKSAESRPSAPAASGDLAQLAEQATHPAIKGFFGSLAVPHDQVLFQRSSVAVNGEKRQRVELIVPTPFYLGDDPGRMGNERLRFRTLTKNFEEDTPLSPDLKTLQSVRPYEEIALENVQSFLKDAGQGYGQKGEKDPLYLSRYALLQAAEQALSSVMRWHQSAIQTGKRSGKEWEQVEKKLRSGLLDVLLEQMKELARVQDWEKVLDLTHRLAVNYGNTDERIFRPVVDMIKQAINNPTNNDETRQLAFKRLHDLEMEFPNNRALQPLSGLLKTRAQGLREAAEELARDKNDPKKLERARAFLKQAEETWPQLEGLGKLRSQIGTDYPILRVGVRGQLPRYFSPAWACTDNEHRVVELLFESLVKLVPDKSGGFLYRPGLAESSPKVVHLGRQFELPRNAFWSDGSPLNFMDIETSLGQLKAGRGVGLARAWGNLVAKAEPMKNPFQLTLRMTQGFLDPLAPMTFKILPRDKPIHDEPFAFNPVTSGPFRLDRSSSGKSDETNRLALVFVANPVYGQRPTKHGTPHIQEIRFYSYADNTDLVKELKNHNLDLVLDLTAQQAEALQKNQQGDIVVPLPSPGASNRRIYFLAVNTQKLDDPKLRQALSSAIDREGLLNKHFRGSLKGLHKELSGPFPAGSWACKPITDDNKESQKLFNLDRAKLLKPQGRTKSYQLKYAVDNPAVNAAMRDLCAQVKEQIGVVLEPMPCTAYQLRNDVEKVRDFDLAYYHYDFPDESYWLGPLFGPSGSNIFKYDNEKLDQLVAGAKSYRGFAQVQEYLQTAQVLLNRELPLIPLWQLDPLMAYRSNVRPSTLDPLLVFDNIENWHLLHK